MRRCPENWGGLLKYTMSWYRKRTGGISSQFLTQFSASHTILLPVKCPFPTSCPQHLLAGGKDRQTLSQGQPSSAHWERGSREAGAERTICWGCRDRVPKAGAAGTATCSPTVLEAGSPCVTRTWAGWFLLRPWGKACSKPFSLACRWLSPGSFTRSSLYTFLSPTFLFL